MAVIDWTRKAIPNWLIDLLPEQVTDFLLVRLAGDIEFVEEDGVYRANGEDFVWYTPNPDVKQTIWCVEFLENYERFLDWLEPGDTVIEVGAATGEYTLPAARAIGDEGCLYAFEPHGKNFVALEKNLEFGDVSNVVTEQLALSDEPGQELEYMVHVGSVSRHQFVETRQDTVDPHDDENYEVLTIATSTVDEYCASHGIDSVDHLKITVNGHERKVLEGARSTLEETTYVSLHHPYPDAETYLESAGFEVAERVETSSSGRPTIYERADD